MKVIVECIPDTILVRTLGIPSRKIHHAGSKGRVIKNVEKGIGTGIIDEDPGYTQPRILSKYTLTSSLPNLGIKILTRNGKRLIVISPRLEEFILEACKESSIDPRRFGLPNDPDHLHKTINAKLQSFRKLLDILIKRKNTRILKLREVILMSLNEQ